MTSAFQVDNFLAYTIGIVVYFAGLGLNAKIAFLRSYNIPEPVTGGILAALASFCLFKFAGIELEYDLVSRDVLLVYFLRPLESMRAFQTCSQAAAPCSSCLSSRWHTSSYKIS